MTDKTIKKVREILARAYNEGYLCGVEGNDPIDRETEVDYCLRCMQILLEKK